MVLAGVVFVVGEAFVLGVAGKLVEFTNLAFEHRGGVNQEHGPD